MSANRPHQGLLAHVGFQLGILKRRTGLNKATWHLLALKNIESREMKLLKTLLYLPLIEVLAITSSCTPVAYDAKGDIYGTVVRADNGLPVQGAAVTLTPGLQSCFTDAAGEFLFSACEVKQYSITVQASGFETNGKNVTVVDRKRVEVIIELRLPDYE